MTKRCDVARHAKERMGAGRCFGLCMIAGTVTAVLVGLTSCTKQSDATQGEAAARQLRRVNVVLAEARMMQFQRVLVLQGNVQAKHLVLVSPRVPGVLNAIYVDEGDEVAAGQTRLFQTDSLKLVQAVEMRKHAVAVAESSLREKQASLENNQADYDEAKYAWDRYRDLYEKGAASNDEMEEMKAEYKRCVAMLKHARALIALTEAQQAQARSALAMAQKALADSLVVAPITGWVSQRYQEPGEMGSPGQPVLRIEDPSVVEVSVYLPAQFYGRVTPQQTAMHVIVNGVDLGDQIASYKSPTIDPKLRTFEVRCLLQEPPAAVAPGAMAHVRIILEQRMGLGVPNDTLQQRGGRTVIFVVHDQVARMIPVEVGLGTDGYREVTSEALTEGVEVVVMGGFFLEPDSPVRVLREEP